MGIDSKTCSLDLASASKRCLPYSVFCARVPLRPPGRSLKKGEMIFRLQFITLFYSLYKRTNEMCCLACFIGDRDLAPAFLLHKKIHSKASFVLIPSTFHPPRIVFLRFTSHSYSRAIDTFSRYHSPPRANPFSKHGLCK
jgi:hypothetical protein